ncbi:MAG: hypothetical protein GF364_07220, partial [Candidatus Lokiarchaeota archaeon]|nr:hypothetical protein [Candidatus Lokiarchaeota archaeon]
MDSTASGIIEFGWSRAPEEELIQAISETVEEFTEEKDIKLVENTFDDNIQRINIVAKDDFFHNMVLELKNVLLKKHSNRKTKIGMRSIQLLDYKIELFIHFENIIKADYWT